MKNEELRIFVFLLYIVVQPIDSHLHLCYIYGNRNN